MVQFFRALPLYQKISAIGREFGPVNIFHRRFSSPFSPARLPPSLSLLTTNLIKKMLLFLGRLPPERCSLNLTRRPANHPRPTTHSFRPLSIGRAIVERITLTESISEEGLHLAVHRKQKSKNDNNSMQTKYYFKFCVDSMSEVTSQQLLSMLMEFYSRVRGQECPNLQEIGEKFSEAQQKVLRAMEVRKQMEKQLCMVELRDSCAKLLLQTNQQHAAHQQSQTQLLSTIQQQQHEIIQLKLKVRALTTQLEEQKQQHHIELQLQALNNNLVALKGSINGMSMGCQDREGEELLVDDGLEGHKQYLALVSGILKNKVEVYDLQQQMQEQTTKTQQQYIRTLNHTLHVYAQSLQQQKPAPLPNEHPSSEQLTKLLGTYSPLLARYEEKIQQLTMQVQHMQQTLQQKEELEHLVSSYEEKYRQLSTEVRTLKEKNSQLMNQVDKLRKERGERENTMKKKDRIIAQKESMIIQKSAHVHQAQTTIKQHQQTIQQQLSTIERQSQRIEEEKRLKQEIIELKNRQQKERKKEKQKQEEKQKQNSKLKQQIQKLKQSHELEIKKEKEKTERQKLEIAQYEEKFQAEQWNKRELNNINKQLDCTINMMEKANMQRTIQYQAKISSLQEQILSLSTDLQTQQRQYIHLTQELHSQQQQITSLQEQQQQNPLPSMDSMKEALSQELSKYWAQKEGQVNSIINNILLLVNK